MKETALLRNAHVAFRHVEGEGETEDRAEEEGRRQERVRRQEDRMKEEETVERVVRRWSLKRSCKGRVGSTAGPICGG